VQGLRRKAGACHGHRGSAFPHTVECDVGAGNDNARNEGGRYPSNSADS
jgi:hypothetical protein